MCRNVGEKVSRSAPHAILTHFGADSARISPPNTLTDSITRFLPEAEPYLSSMTRTTKSIP